MHLEARQAVATTEIEVEVEFDVEELLQHFTPTAAPPFHVRPAVAAAN